MYACMYVCTLYHSVVINEDNALQLLLPRSIVASHDVILASASRSTGQAVNEPAETKRGPPERPETKQTPKARNQLPNAKV